MKIERSTNCSSIEEIERMIKKTREDNNTNFSNIEEMIKFAQRINKIQMEGMSDNTYNSNSNGITINNTFIFR